MSTTSSPGTHRLRWLPDPAADLRLADYADAVAALVRALGVGPVHLAGHSFGAGLAIGVYGRHRQLVRSLVLSGAYAGWRGSLPPTEVEARLPNICLPKPY